MLYDLEELLDKPANHDLTKSDFVEAADRLLAAQCLFRYDHSSQKAYDLIVRFKGYFTNLFDALGRNLVIQERDLTIELHPGESHARVILKLDQTVMLLSLRAAFENGVKTYTQGEFGVVAISSMELIEAYQSMFPARIPWPRFREILAEFRRRRFIDLGDEYADEKGMEIIVRPSIISVTGDGWEQRIEEFCNAKAAGESDLDEGAAAEDGPSAGQNENTNADAVVAPQENDQ
jgi:hypothetical protein